MEDFKTKIGEILKDAGFSMDSKIPEHDITFEEITDYFAKVSGGYDHELIDKIQLYKYHNMNIEDIFKERAENVTKYRERYSQIEKVEETQSKPRARRRLR